MRITPKDWGDFQHYKDRDPTWIKLHKKLLDNFEFHQLPAESRALAPMLWLLCSEHKDGVIEGTEQKIAFRLHTTVGALTDALMPLVQAGFFSMDAVAGEMARPAKSLAQENREKNGFGSRHISDAVKREVWDRDGGKCQCCDSVENIEYDHIVPVSRGGESTIDNIQLLCRPCNRSKRTKTAEQFATEKLNSRSLEKEISKKVETQVEEEVGSAFAEALNAYNAIASELKWPEAQALNKSRKAKLSKRMASVGGLGGWRAAMAKARASPWLRGDVPRGKGYETWAPDIDFFLQESTFTKLMEGKYDQRGRVQSTGFDALREGARRAAGLDGGSGEGMVSPDHNLHRLAISGNG